MSVEEKLIGAANLLEDAERETDCGWCAGNIRAAKKVLWDLSEVVPFTNETAQRVRASSMEEIEKLGGKVAVLKKVVQDARKPVETGKDINNAPKHRAFRGIPMDGRIKSIVVPQLALGTGLGFALNRLDEYWVAERAKTGSATAFYERLGPAINLVVGLGLVLLGATGRVFKTPEKQLMAIAGGGVMLSNAALAYAEGLYAMPIVPSGRPAAKAYYPMGARTPGTINPRMVEIDSF